MFRARREAVRVDPGEVPPALKFMVDEVVCNAVATQLEEHPLEFAREHLEQSGWTSGVHA